MRIINRMKMLTTSDTLKIFDWYQKPVNEKYEKEDYIRSAEHYTNQGFRWLTKAQEKRVFNNIKITKKEIGILDRSIEVRENIYHLAWIMSGESL